jgi:DNA repair exonuclease SbcCD ATPase subunit
MRLLALKVADFGAVEHAEIELGPGLNVLHGPNDLGKSTLAAALRAVLLLPHGSSAAGRYAPWHSGKTPTVTLSFAVQDRIWRVTKSWARGSGGSSMLEYSNDGRTFSPEERGRGVDGRLRALLGWGIPEPGGRGGRHGLPSSFLTTVLLAEQAVPHQVLGESLLEDGTEAGRERLIEAMAALAQHPVFKAVLDGAQKKVDEAFTSTGKRKRGKDSPFARRSEEIANRQAEYDHLRQRLAEADGVSGRLAELDARRDRLMTICADARERLETLERELERTRVRARAQTLLDAARSRLGEIHAQMAEVSRCRRDKDEIEGALPATLESAQQATMRRRSAEGAVHAAEAAMQSAQGDAGPDARALERRKLQLEAERMRVSSACAQAEEALELERKGVELDGACAVKREQLDALQIEHAQLDEARARLREEQARVADALKLRRLEGLERRLDELRGARARADEHRERADTIEAEAERVDASGEARLPDRATLERLEALFDAARYAEAALGGGLALEVDLQADVALGATIDGEAWPEPVGFRTFEAERTAELRIGDVAKVRVVSGDVERRRAAEEARRRFADAVQPVLLAAGVDDLEALRQAVARAQERRATVGQQRAQAAECRRIAEAADVEDAAIDGARRDVEAATRELADVDRAVVTEGVGDVDEGTLRRREAEGTVRGTALAEATDRLAGRRAELRLEIETATTRRHDLGARLEAVRTALQDEPSRAAETGRARLEAIDEALAKIDDELRAHGEAAQARATEARLAVERAREAAETACAEESRLQAEAASLQEKRSAIDARLELHLAQLERVDEAAARDDVELRERELAALPKPELPVDEDTVEEARRLLEARQQELDEVEAEVRKAEGALQQVGGQVVRERAEVAREALDRARREASELELDYDAWLLLVETLREAENDEGQNLGRVLGDAVAARFAELTRGRYGEVALTPDLKTEGIRAAGEVRSIESLSEGLKEQLATLLRISVAQQLRCALVLDDHLTQTDPTRIEWFRDVLRSAATSVQFVVLTCRPTDYLRPHELTSSPTEPHVRVIDLGAVIRRA